MTLNIEWKTSDYGIRIAHVEGCGGKLEDMFYAIGWDAPHYPVPAIPIETLHSYSPAYVAGKAQWHIGQWASNDGVAFRAWMQEEGNDTVSVWYRDGYPKF